MATVTVDEPRAAPARSLQQRLDALERANAIRTGRSRLKQDLKAGRASIQDLLLDPPALILTAKVAVLLSAVPKIGPMKAAALMKRCVISPSKTCGGLSYRQRVHLASLLTGSNQRPVSKARDPHLLSLLAAVLATHPDGCRCRVLADALGWTVTDTRTRLCVLRNRGLAGYERGIWHS